MSVGFWTPSSEKWWKWGHRAARNTHTLPLAADLVSAIEAVALDDASARSVGALDADQIPLFSPVSADPVVQAVRQQRYTGDYTAEMLLA